MDSLQEIIATCGLSGTITPVVGGDINACYRIQNNTSTYFIKINDAGRYPHMLEKEARGLQALSRGTLVVPEVVKHGVVGNHQYLILSWLDRTPATARHWEQLGSGLANLHRQAQAQFGWTEDNYIGSLQQDNTPHTTWGEFYYSCRLNPLIKKLLSIGALSDRDTALAAHLGTRIDSLFPQEAPALLHGDLWGGNFMITTQGAALIDPAVYAGHREMDLGMTLLFGGFDNRFYEAYEEVYPLEKGWRKRVWLTQLYPLLVHAVLFGGHYIYRVRELLTHPVLR